MSQTFRVGDKVWVDLGLRRFPGRISEDRGRIGVGGRQIFQVQVSMDPVELTLYEIPAEELELRIEPTGPAANIDKNKIISYLSKGGLKEILRSNLAGGRYQPRVWLRPNSVGNITHTFEEDMGVLGGQPVPFLAIHGGRIFLPKREEVLSFLRGFDLDLGDAERIIDVVGTSPGRPARARR